jgi:Domain of unknown function (DUF222)
VLSRWVSEDPCPEAVTELAGIDPTTLDDADRVRLLIGLERQSAWLASLALPVLVAIGDSYVGTVADARQVATERLAAAEQADQPAAAGQPGAGADPGGDGRGVADTVGSIFGADPDRWAAAEIAAALRIAEFTAAGRLELARDLPVRLPLLDAALRQGQVSFGHVLLVARETAPLTDQLARLVDGQLAHRYGTSTPGGLRNRARHATLAADPAGAAERHDQAARRRSLHTRPEADAMATLVLFGSAIEVATVEAAAADIADRTAAAATAAGRHIPDRDSLLADAMSALARFWLHDTWPIPEPDPRHHHPEAEHPSNPAAASPGSGSASPPAGEPPHDSYGFHGEGVPDQARAEIPPRMGKRGRRRPGRDHTVVNIVIDLPTLLGLAQHPARLDGYGPIPPQLARRLAGDATWRRMITDPLTRELLDRSPRTYRPGDRLAAYIRARDLHCDHPGCTRHADACQLDHDAPFDLTDPDGGRTIATDLHPRCQPHHNAKTHLGWATGVRPDGTRYTRSPHGHDYTLEQPAYLSHGSLLRR